MHRASSLILAFSLLATEAAAGNGTARADLLPHGWIRYRAGQLGGSASIGVSAKDANGNRYFSLAREVKIWEGLAQMGGAVDAFATPAIVAAYLAVQSGEDTFTLTDQEGRKVLVLPELFMEMFGLSVTEDGSGGLVIDDPSDDLAPASVKEGSMVEVFVRHQHCAGCELNLFGAALKADHSGKRPALISTKVGAGRWADPYNDADTVPWLWSASREILRTTQVTGSLDGIGSAEELFAAAEGTTANDGSYAISLFDLGRRKLDVEKGYDFVRVYERAVVSPFSTAPDKLTAIDPQDAIRVQLGIDQALKEAGAADKLSASALDALKCAAQAAFGLPVDSALTDRDGDGAVDVTVLSDAGATVVPGPDLASVAAFSLADPEASVNTGILYVATPASAGVVGGKLAGVLAPEKALIAQANAAGWILTSVDLKTGGIGRSVHTVQDSFSAGRQAWLDANVGQGYALPAAKWPTYNRCGWSLHCKTVWAK